MSYFQNADTVPELKHQFRMLIIKYGNNSPEFNPQLLQEVYNEYQERYMAFLRRDDYVSPMELTTFMFEEDNKERKALRNKRFWDIIRNKDEKLLRRTFRALKSLFQPVEHVSWVERAKLHQQKLKEEEERKKAAEESQPAETAQEG